jgi:hypothetical protein
MEATDGRVVGEIGVAVAVERLLRSGYAVAVPLVDDGYDLLAFSGRKHWRIQVKASAASGHHGRRVRLRRGRARNEPYCPTHVDAFVLVNTRTGVVGCVPVAATNGSRWLYWSSVAKWGDFSVLRKIKTQRC